MLKSKDSAAQRVNWSQRGKWAEVRQPDGEIQMDYQAKVGRAVLKSKVQNRVWKLGGGWMQGTVSISYSPGPIPDTGSLYSNKLIPQAGKYYKDG